MKKLCLMLLILFCIAGTTFAESQPTDVEKNSEITTAEPQPTDVEKNSEITTAEPQPTDVEKNSEITTAEPQPTDVEKNSEITTTEPQPTDIKEHRIIVVIPYLDTTEQGKQHEYISETMNELYTNYFNANGFTVILAEDLEKALAQAGYASSNQMLPEKDIMAEIAQAVGADYVVAVDLTELDANHKSYFSKKVGSFAKLNYHFYKAKTDELIPFQTTASKSNKSVTVGEKSYPSSISATLAEALEKGNAKIQSFL